MVVVYTIFLTSNQVNSCGYIAFDVIQNGGRPPFWICGANFGTTHHNYLEVFITVQNVDEFLQSFW